MSVCRTGVLFSPKENCYQETTVGITDYFPGDQLPLLAKANPKHMCMSQPIQAPLPIYLQYNRNPFTLLQGEIIGNESNKGSDPLLLHLDTAVSLCGQRCV